MEGAMGMWKEMCSLLTVFICLWISGTISNFKPLLIDDNLCIWILISGGDHCELCLVCRTGMNKGYAFVNFTNSEAALKFTQTTSNQKWDLFQSLKIREVVRARLQVNQIICFKDLIIVNLFKHVCRVLC